MGSKFNHTYTLGGGSEAARDKGREDDGAVGTEIW